MPNTDNLKRFETDLAASEELRKEFDEVVKRIAASGGVESDGELMMAAAAELGYDVSKADLERAMAEAQEMDDAELEMVAGGEVDLQEDEYGHDNYCLTLWHCHIISMHTETKGKTAACWSDYTCVFVNNDPAKWGL